MKRNEDRRSTLDDRRNYHSIEYFENGGEERRDFYERRFQDERRKDWYRISEWSSVHIIPEK